MKHGLRIMLAKNTAYAVLAQVNLISGLRANFYTCDLLMRGRSMAERTEPHI